MLPDRPARWDLVTGFVVWRAGPGGIRIHLMLVVVLLVWLFPDRTESPAAWFSIIAFGDGGYALSRCLDFQKSRAAFGPRTRAYRGFPARVAAAHLLHPMASQASVR